MRLIRCDACIYLPPRSTRDYPACNGAGGTWEPEPVPMLTEEEVDALLAVPPPLTAEDMADAMEMMLTAEELAAPDCEAGNEFPTADYETT